MARVMVGLLAAVSAVTSAIVGLVHGDLIWPVLGILGVAAGLVASAGAVKKISATSLSALLYITFSDEG